jgi:hypothetical protein
MKNEKIEKTKLLNQLKAEYSFLKENEDYFAIETQMFDDFSERDSSCVSDFSY